jgi:hypothetical protein
MRYGHANHREKTLIIEWYSIIVFSLCGGGLEYLHRSRARRQEREKGDEKRARYLGVELGHPAAGGHKYTGLGPSDWGLDARLTTLLCKKNTVAKSKVTETGWSEVWQDLLRKVMGQQGPLYRWWHVNYIINFILYDLHLYYSLLYYFPV